MKTPHIPKEQQRLMDAAFYGALLVLNKTRKAEGKKLYLVPKEYRDIDAAYQKQKASSATMKIAAETPEPVGFKLQPRNRRAIT